MPQNNPINILGLDHVVLRTENMERMIDFYRDALGCRLERGPGDIGLAQMRAGRAMIDILDVEGPLGSRTGGSAASDARNMDHFCIQVRPWDVAVITAHLEQHGVEIGEVVTRYGAQGNGPSIYIQDPDGNTVELKGPPHH